MKVLIFKGRVICLLNVAIVEDDYRVAAIHEQFLSKINGVKLVGKSLNGKETHDLIQNNPIDLVLLDIYIPDMLGTDLIKDIRAENPRVGIIIISAATEKPMVEDTIQKGIFDYIIKPVTMERFIETIKRYMHTRKMLDVKQEIDQSFLDQYFGFKKELPNSNRQTPKGIDPLTLETVKNLMSDFLAGITAEEMGEKMGASRTTARRYLEHLTSTGEGNAELEYGIVGRPERKYYLL